MAPKRTKIVCTIGPASQDEAVLEALMRAGMNVARLNFSHGSHEDHRRNYARVRAVAKRLDHPLAILQDLQGPKTRVGRMMGDGEMLVEGTRVCIVPGDDQTEPGVIPTTYRELPSDVRAGDAILMDDGLIQLRVADVKNDRVACDVLVGGRLTSRKGINLPGVALSAPSLTVKDLADMELGVELGVDFVCISFVRSPTDVLGAKRRLAELGVQTPVIAKIEKPQAVEALDGIVDVADGIMVARGDLGVEMGPEKVPLLQKHAIELANSHGKLVITATQMLESMVHASFPTRAEASDVANAVLDQSDALMLSAETATGDHPVLAVETMARIVREVEGSERYRRLSNITPRAATAPSNAIAHAAAAAADTLPGMTAVVCISFHGTAPRLLSDCRPQAPIYALVGSPSDGQRLAAFWGVHPILFERTSGTEETIAAAEEVLVSRGLLQRGDMVVLTMAVPPGPGHHTNTLKIHRVGH